MTGTETISCPNCQGDLKPYDRCKRGLIDGEGVKKMYWLRRLHCKACAKTHRELPDIMVPFKRYSAAVIESVIEGKARSVPYDERTRQKFRAWYKAVKSHLQGIWQQQVKQGFASPDIIPNFVSLVRATVNSGNWLYHPFGRVGYAL